MCRMPLLVNSRGTVVESVQAHSSVITVLYFSAVRERVARSSEQVPLDTQIPVSVLIERMCAHDPALSGVFNGPDIVRVAVNCHLAEADTLVSPGDEVAFFPPMTGG